METTVQIKKEQFEELIGALMKVFKSGDKTYLMLWRVLIQDHFADLSTRMLCRIEACFEENVQKIPDTTDWNDFIALISHEIDYREDFLEETRTD
jgi:hypothetical protein